MLRTIIIAYKNTIYNAYSVAVACCMAYSALTLGAAPLGFGTLSPILRRHGYIFVL